MLVARQRLTDSTIDSITIIDCIAFAAIITVIAVTSAVNTVTDLDHSAWH